MSFWNDLTSTYHKIENRAEHAVNDLNAQGHAAADKLSNEAHGLAKSLSKAANNGKRELTSIGHAIEGTVGKALAAENKADRFVTHEALLLDEGLVTGAVLNPVNALRQVGNHVFGTHINKIEFGNQNEVDHSVAGVVGEFLGTAAVFIATDGAASAVTGLAACSVGTMAIAGAVQGAALTPTKENASGVGCLEERVAGGIIGGGAAAVMGLVGGKIGEALEQLGVSKFVKTSEGGDLLDWSLPAPKPAPIAPVLRHGLSNTIGGGTGGLVQAEGQSLFEYGRLASVEELAGKMGMSAAGWTPPEGGSLLRWVP